MNQKDYQLLHDKVFANYDKMPPWVKDWSLELLSEALNRVKAEGEGKQDETTTSPLGERSKYDRA